MEDNDPGSLGEEISILERYGPSGAKDIAFPEKYPREPYPNPAETGISIERYCRDRFRQWVPRAAQDYVDFGRLDEALHIWADLERDYILSDDTFPIIYRSIKLELYQKLAEATPNNAVLWEGLLREIKQMLAFLQDGPLRDQISGVSTTSLDESDPSFHVIDNYRRLEMQYFAARKQLLLALVPSNLRIEILELMQDLIRQECPHDASDEETLVITDALVTFFFTKILERKPDRSTADLLQEPSYSWKLGSLYRKYAERFDELAAKITE